MALVLEDSSWDTIITLVASPTWATIVTLEDAEWAAV